MDDGASLLMENANSLDQQLETTTSVFQSSFLNFNNTIEQLKRDILSGKEKVDEAANGVVVSNHRAWMLCYFEIYLLQKLCTEINENNESTKVVLDTSCKQWQEKVEVISSVLEDTNFNIRNEMDDVENQLVIIKNNVEQFYNAELVYPKHAGDTPQRKSTMPRIMDEVDLTDEVNYTK